MKRKNPLDPRTNRGILARGKNMYPSGSPNPTGKNQHIKKAAQARMRRKI